MRFSVIIPVYNVEPYLRECLDSMLQQTCPDWEAVCVDDGSTDGSAGILSEYASRDSRFRIVTQPNGGLSAARNTGLDHATGDYILFLDSDDWLEPNTLQTLQNNLNGEDMLCFGGWRGNYEDCPDAAHYPTGWDYYNSCVFRQQKFPFVCVVLRCYRRAMLEANSLRFREGFLHEDNHFTPRVCLASGPVKVLNTSLYRYRVRPGSIMTTRSLRSRQDMIRIANDLATIFINQNKLERTVVYRALAQYYQAALIGATRQESRQLRPLVDWHLYHTVSRTRPRHRLNYALLRISPTLFRLMCHRQRHLLRPA